MASQSSTYTLMGPWLNEKFSFIHDQLNRNRNRDFEKYSLKLAHFLGKIRWDQTQESYLFKPQILCSYIEFIVIFYIPCDLKITYFSHLLPCSESAWTKLAYKCHACKSSILLALGRWLALFIAALGRTGWWTSCFSDSPWDDLHGNTPSTFQ